jgi:cytochrome c oxidase cbb3-type subunit 3
MSDFFNSGWSVFIAVATVASLVACLALLVVASKRRVMADDNTTGHVWDEDVRELNNPLPRWWMWLFVITVVFSAIYLALYPGLGSLAGTLKWSSSGQFEAEQARARETIAPIYAKYASMSAEQLAKTPDAMAIGERLYLNSCSQCHGSDARGSKGFPDLTDGDWLGGSGADYIAKTIAEGRQGAMPPMAAAIGTGDDVRNVANYVLSLSGSPHDNVAAQLGKAKFAACAACHGPDGKGNQAIGAPNLTDKVWLHGWGEDAIVAQISAGKTNVMPAHEQRLSPEQLQVLAAYVWGKSNAGAAPAAKP